MTGSLIHRTVDPVSDFDLMRKWHHFSVLPDSRPSPPLFLVSNVLSPGLTLQLPNKLLQPILLASMNYVPPGHGLRISAPTQSHVTSVRSLSAGLVDLEARTWISSSIALYFRFNRHANYPRIRAEWTPRLPSRFQLPRFYRSFHAAFIAAYNLLDMLLKNPGLWWYNPTSRESRLPTWSRASRNYISCWEALQRRQFQERHRRCRRTACGICMSYPFFTFGRWV